LFLQSICKNEEKVLSQNAGNYFLSVDLRLQRDLLDEKEQEKESGQTRAQEILSRLPQACSFSGEKVGLIGL
jgi:hypothetical protein